MIKEIKMQSSKLAKQILIAMLLGISIGLIADLAEPFISPDSWVYNTFLVISDILHIAGQIFITSMKMLVVPLILFSLVTGIASLTHLATLGRIGAKTIAFYISTTFIALVLAVTFGNLIKVGQGAALALEKPISIASPPPLIEAIIHMVPTNPIDAMAKGDMLQVIVFAILVGIGLALMKKRALPLRKFFSDMNDLTMRIVFMIMQFSPYGIFALLVETFAKTGYSVAGPLLKYALTMVFVMAVHFFGTNSLLLVLFSRLNFFHLLKKIRPALMIAFSTASSNATMPTTLTLIEKKVGVSNRVASFTIPLGTTMNMDGTAIMQALAATFIAHAYQIELGIHGYLIIILTALFSSIGSAGVPGTGLVTLTMVLHQAGLPIEGIGLIIGFDRLLEMIRTMLNVFGDVVITCIVAKTEDQIDLKIFNKNE